MTGKKEVWMAARRPLDINGMAGQMVVLPAPKTHASVEILFLYDQNSSLEQWRPVIEFLNRYGAVTAPDLPGFGGMDSFFSIGRRPTVNAYADYLAAFFTFRFRRKQVIVVAAGFGFVAITRMLQRYPLLQRHIRRIVSLNGYVRHDDVDHASPRHGQLQRAAYRFGRSWVPTQIVRYVYLNDWMLPRLVARSRSVLAQTVPEARAASMAQMISLWRGNDLRTRFYTTAELFKLDNCARTIPLPLWHVHFASSSDHHHQRAKEQRLRVVFRDATFTQSKVTTADLFRLDAKLAASLIDAKLRQQLSKP